MEINLKWIPVNKSEIDSWDQKLKNSEASFFQYPYYASGYNHFFLCKVVYIKLIDPLNNEKAFCTILKIGFPPCKIGLIIRGPVILDEQLKISEMLLALKQYAKNNKYALVRINPNITSIEKELRLDNDFEARDYFPAYKGSQSKDFNVYNTPEENLLTSFRRDCRNKIRYTEELDYDFVLVKTARQLKEVYELFKKIGEDKHFKYRPFKSYSEIFLNGQKNDLCSIYTARLNEQLVCAAFIVKDKRSYNYFSGALYLNNIKPKNSPANKLQYLAMQDCFYKENKHQYNLSYSGPGSGVYMFKNSFHPQVYEMPEYYTYIINHRVSSFIISFQEKRIRQLRNFFRGIIKLVKR